MQELTTNNYTTGEQHKELSTSRVSKDKADLVTVATKLDRLMKTTFVQTSGLQFDGYQSDLLAAILFYYVIFGDFPVRGVCLQLFLGKVV